MGRRERGGSTSGFPRTMVIGGHEGIMLPTARFARKKGTKKGNFMMVRMLTALPRLTMRRGCRQAFGL
jgi:hypothetical protein